MKSTEVKKKILELGEWEFWLERTFPPFLVSFFIDGSKRKHIKALGVEGVALPAILYQRNAYHRNKSFDRFVRQFGKYIERGGSFERIIRSCERYWVSSKARIARINKSKNDPLKKLEQIYNVIAPDIAYVWLTNAADTYYETVLHKEIPKYYKGDIGKFIGDASYPSKKNAHHYFEAALRGNKSLQAIQKEFGWIKVRDGFSDPFSLAELKKERLRLKKENHVRFVPPKIPRQLRSLIKTTQELVYMRTLRSDIFHNLMFLARPTFLEVAQLYNISFKDLRHYSVIDLIQGKPKLYPDTFSFGWVEKGYAFFDKPLTKEIQSYAVEVKGTIANLGRAKGVAKIVKTAHQIDKVQKGDILFAPSTAPSYIIGMKKAAAFVTDEGGITSHAAIVSREMNKPCIIGTKTGTKIFQDGDLVEVDATTGVIKKLKK